jgi:hypothetical protein
MKTHRLAAAAITLLLIAGCSTVPKEAGIPKVAAPAAAAAEGGAAAKAIVDAPLSELRERLNRGTAAEGLSVQASPDRLDTWLVRYSGEPKSYVDCGRFISVAKLGKNARRTEFPAASPLQRHEIMMGQRAIAVERRVSLDATLTLTLSALDAQRTGVGVEAVYRATRSQTLRLGRTDFTTEASVTFDGTSGMPLPDSQSPCQSTGQLEAEVVAMLARRSQAVRIDGDDPTITPRRLSAFPESPVPHAAQTRAGAGVSVEGWL